MAQDRAASGVAEQGSWGLAGYRVGPVVGQGGFATVYRAEQLSLNRPVALKVMLADLGTEAHRQRFDQERDILVRLGEHPYVVDVHDAGLTPEDRPFIVMRLYGAGSLAARLQRTGPLPVAETVAVIARIASALDAAHAMGVLHRDVKPENVLLTDTGEPALSDFGICALAGPALGAGAEGAFFTVAHAAPEVLEHQRFSVASDVYALASTAYQLLAGRPAFEGVGLQTMTRIISTDPPPLPGPYLPSAVQAVIRQGMAKDPARRPATAGDFARALAAAAAGSDPRPPGPAGAPVPPGAPVPLGTPGPAARTQLAVLAVAVLVAAGGWAVVNHTPLSSPGPAMPTPALTSPGGSPPSSPAPGTGTAGDGGVSDAGRPTGTGGGGTPTPTTTTDAPVLTPAVTIVTDRAPTAIAFQGRTSLLAVPLNAGGVSLVDVTTGKPARTLKPGQFSGGNMSAVASADGRVVAAGGSPTTVWRTGGSRPPVALVNRSTSGSESAGGTVGHPALALNPDGQRLVTVKTGSATAVLFWDTVKGKLLGQLDPGDDEIYGVATTADGRTVAVLTPNKLTVLDMGSPLWTGHPVSRRVISFSDEIEAAGCLAISPDGKTVAVTAAEYPNALDLWDLASGKVRATVRVPSIFAGRAREVAFSPDGRWLAATSASASAVWDAGSLEVGYMLPERNEYRAIAWARDGATFATVDSSDLRARIRVWKLS